MAVRRLFRYAITRFIFSAAVLLFMFSSSYAFDMKISPDVIKPGDPFILKVESSGSEPSAVFEGRALPQLRCGNDCYLFIGAVDVAASPGRYAVNVSSSSKSATAEFDLQDGNFREIYLTLSQDKVFLSPENLERVIKEKSMLDAVFLSKTPVLWTGSFVYPLDSDVTSDFGIKRIINKNTTSIHRGIDMRAKTGDLVRASNTGRVVIAQELFYGGNTVIVDHGIGIFTIYMHLSEFKISKGDMVSKNQIVGLAGSTGRSSGPHLHFGVKIQSLSVNPVSFLGLGI